LGYVGEPYVKADGELLVEALASAPNAIPGSLKEVWLG